MDIEASPVRIAPWSEDDLTLLHAANAPELMRHLGGPETDEAVAERHARYVALSAESMDKGRMFRVELVPTGEAVGTIGFWERTWQGEQVYETGWAILPPFQGRGLASAATRAVVEAARAQQHHRHLHAFPSVDNPASNGVCRKAGFLLQGECALEYPVGHAPMRCNDWRLDLEAPGIPSS
ncbi:GNAT family N-acetyltransferase [Streptomyces liangshanensis]|uniref:GNAT family N-acetyltransferase n=1 Tax=Streptomyces liangshanensis TaxID=2717324 RepID=UPI0036DD8687